MEPGPSTPHRHFRPLFEPRRSQLWPEIRRTQQRRLKQRRDEI